MLDAFGVDRSDLDISKGWKKAAVGGAATVLAGAALASPIRKPLIEGAKALTAAPAGARLSALKPAGAALRPRVGRVAAGAGIGGALFGGAASAKPKAPTVPKPPRVGG